MSVSELRNHPRSPQRPGAAPTLEIREDGISKY